MNSREMVLAALNGEMPDRVPFVIWNNKLPGGDIASQLLELGACIVNKSTVYNLEYIGIEIETEPLAPIEGLKRRRNIFTTPAGEITTIERIVPGSIWLEKMPFGGPEDYEALEKFIQSRVYVPCYEKFLADDTMYAGQSLARPQTIYTPIQDLICKYMGVEKFCIEWADRPERLFKLCEVIAADRQKRLQIVARSPARFVVIEGNIVPEVTGPKRFRRYHVPYIEQGCELLHQSGKLAGAHFDGNNRIISEAIAETSLDLIESFTPPPDCNLPLAEALRLWPDKTIQINFPSSLHLYGKEKVKETARAILKQAAPGNRFIVGISEDISGGGVDTLVPLAEAVLKYGRLPIGTG